MNPVEIEQAVSDLAAEPFDAAEFPFKFLEAFGNKTTTIKKLRAGTSNKSDVPGGVLQRSNIHIAVCGAGAVTQTLTALRESPATANAKAKFILATDGADFEAENLTSGDVIACAYADFPNHFGFFLPLAGIATVREISESAFDIRATGKLNRLYMELLKTNPDWEQRQHDMNHFMARLIFCFFAEDTDIFMGSNYFTATVDKMSAGDSSNTHEVIGELFRTMNTPIDERKNAETPGWADMFPYVNGELFSGNMDVPRFSKFARSYLLNIGGMNWQQINPDIFGSMVQAISEDEERGKIGLHYTSVPNILKVLNPLFLDDLHAQLAAAENNKRKLLNLRNRMSRIRVFDPACGSGNFLVIAYKEMRAIEAEINTRRGELERRSDMPPTNFRGIEIRDFPAEIARLALIIAEFQCDVLYRGQKEALAEFLPLDSENWITCGNALRLDWLNICPPTGTGVKVTAEDLLETPLEQAEVDFENQGGETYICGNPPYKGTKKQTKEEKSDLQFAFNEQCKTGALDYIAGWFFKAALYADATRADFAFVSTNSVCQGIQVPVLWPLLFERGLKIKFAYRSFKWRNLASNNAGVTVIVAGLSKNAPAKKRLFLLSADEKHFEQSADVIGPYLIPGTDAIVQRRSAPTSNLPSVSLGNGPFDGGHLILETHEVAELGLNAEEEKKWLRPLLGSDEIISGKRRICLWIENSDLTEARANNAIQKRIESVKKFRLGSRDAGTRAMANRPHQFREMHYGRESTIGIPLVSSESREFLTPALIGRPCSMTNTSYAIYDGPLFCLALISSKLHLAWITAVCGKLETRIRYSNRTGWNTFPLPPLMENQKAELTRCAEDILLAREAHFPATIADLYKPDAMPEDLQRAHDRNDEMLERIYIGRRFKNDTERLEKLFDMYASMTAEKNAAKLESQA